MTLTSAVVKSGNGGTNKKNEKKLKKAFEPMGKPIGYNPARLQRAYLPVPGIELMKKGNPDCRLNTTDRQPTTGNRQPGTDNR